MSKQNIEKITQNIHVKLVQNFFVQHVFLICIIYMDMVKKGIPVPNAWKDLKIEKLDQNMC